MGKGGHNKINWKLERDILISMLEKVNQELEEAVGIRKDIEMPDPAPEPSPPSKARKVKPVKEPLPKHSPPPAIAKLVKRQEEFVETVPKAYTEMKIQEHNSLIKRLAQIKEGDMYDAVKRGVDRVIRREEEKSKKGNPTKLPPEMMTWKPRDFHG